MATLIESLMLVVMMFMMVIPVIVMLVIVLLVVMMMLVIVMLVFVMLVFVMTVLRGIVGCSGVNVEFYTGDPCASLSLEMKVAIAEFQFRELPFESGRGDSQIG
jgi:hypothetical protein